MGLAQDIGNRGEQAAVDWLLDAGFALRHRNWRSGRYELDIIAEKGDTVHFVEVKCRKSGGLTTPEEAITETKFRSLATAANAYIEEYKIDLEVQFDLISVEYSEYAMEVRYVPNAMIPRW